jgi:hypothetical protein
MVPDPHESCLCGSGRPFGSCCAERFCSELSAWLRVHRTEERLARRIVAYGRRTWGPELFNGALSAFFMSRTSSQSVYSTTPAFVRWCPFTWVPDWRAELEHQECPIPKDWPTASLGVTWLASESPRVSDFEQSFVITTARSPHSLLLIESIIPGWSLVVRDLLTGRRFRVVEPEISREVRPEEILFSAVLTLDGVSTLLGCASHTIPSDLRVMARETRECHAKGAWLTRAQLLEITHELSSEYREACDCDSVNELETYGEEPERLLLRWSVSAPFVEIFERVRSLSVWYGDDEAIHDETGPDGVPRLLMSWYEPPPPPNPEDRDALAFLYLDDGRLAAHVATRAIAERLMGEITARLGAAATLVETRPSLPVRIPTLSDSFPPPPRIARHTPDAAGR